MDLVSQLRASISSPSVRQSIALLLLLFIAYYVVVIIYRLTLHPLAKYPGPFFSKISDWAIVYQTATGNRHLRQLKEHETYGPVVRIGPNTVSINTVAGLEEIYANRKANVKKSDWYRSTAAAGHAGSTAQSTHTEIDRERHAFRRRVLGHAFSDSAIRSAETFVLANIRTWCKHLSEGAQPGEWTHEKNMDEWCTYLAYDIMGDLVFGKRFNVMENDEHREVPAIGMSALRFIYPAAYAPLQTILRPIFASPLMLKLGGRAARDALRFIEYAQSQVASRKLAEEATSNGSSDKPARKDFMHYLLSARDPKTGAPFLTKEELDADSGLLISAGADTTAITLAGLFFYLIHNPGALKLATAEVRRTFADVEEIVAGPKLNSCVYTHGCIDEALRLSPPVTGHLPREVLAGGLMIEGEFFPEGTIVGTSAYAIHHHPDYYPDPFSFKPERWISNPQEYIPDAGTATTAQDVATAKAAFCPFSLGTRGCIGKTLAYQEMMLAIARVLWLFDVRKPQLKLAGAGAGGAGEDASAVRVPTGEGDPKAAEEGRRRVGEYQLRDYFLGIREGPGVEFRRRAAC
ncbi:hypothetical protein EPUS_05239 [Endocarpon pusillum Z07020]|uniref:Isotrichodermin C-15 hydroxylase n=1 Tax=Endocarpon pusillum (strain Z07020 / HMAS-L-300199) TaxID=1263415 RepID=U1G858_ENDPU|nr:uncharacterized protein EPUS_05239 [Endocarpon pusillum Z07020]ERF68158.1 hypothetical protein EPUS_05239 [Endocarpon pusillum Z07020]